MVRCEICGATITKTQQLRFKGRCPTCFKETETVIEQKTHYFGGMAIKEPPRMSMYHSDVADSVGSDITLRETINVTPIDPFRFFALSGFAHAMSYVDHDAEEKKREEEAKKREEEAKKREEEAKKREATSDSEFMRLWKIFQECKNKTS